MRLQAVDISTFSKVANTNPRPDTSGVVVPERDKTRSGK